MYQIAQQSIKQTKNLPILAKMITSAFDKFDKMDFDEPGGSLTFESITGSAFDKKGVLYALGTDFGKTDYTNPADSGKVRFDWSHDAANFYSTAGGHKEGDAK